MEKMFICAPWWMKNILVSIMGLKLKIKRSGGAVININDYEELEIYHKDQIRNLLNDCLESPYYSSQIKKFGVDVAAENILLELIKLPVIEKNEIRSNVKNIEIPNVKSSIAKTSGTTGSGLVFKTTRYSESSMWSFFTRFRGRIGLKDSKDWCGYFCGRTVKNNRESTGPYWVFNYPGKQIIFSSYHLNKKSVQSYIACLNRKQPPWIHGYPSFLFLLAKLSVEEGLSLNYSPRAITYGSENLKDDQRKVIEGFFNTKGYDLYCQTEGVAMFSECEYGSMHVDEEFSYVEFIPVKDDKYEVVGTSLFNRAFPFLRYRTGDIVELSSKQCECGRTSRIVKNIDGRDEDYIELNDGVKVGRLDHIFKSMTHIIEAQIVQKKDKSVLFRVVKSTDYNDKDEQLLRGEIFSRMSNKIDYEIVYTDKIERTKSGKLRFVVKE